MTLLGSVLPASLRARLSRLTRGVLYAALLGAFVNVFAQTHLKGDYGYPSRPVKIIVPFAPGGTTDAVSRKLGEILAKKWGQPVVVEARPGAGTIIGVMSAVNAPADGYTLLLVADASVAINPLLYSDLPYNPAVDLAPVVLLNSFPMTIAVSAKLPIKDLKSLIDYRERSLNYGSFGPGTNPQLVMESLKALSGLDAVHIPYKGVGPLMLALASGEIDVSSLSSGAALQVLQSGTARILAIDGERRLPQLPDVPTFAEAGFPRMRAPAWWAIVVRKSTPDAIVSKLNADINEAIKDPLFQQFMSKNAFIPGGGTPAELAARISDTQKLWAPIIEKLELRRKMN